MVKSFSLIQLYYSEMDVGNLKLKLHYMKKFKVYIKLLKISIKITIQNLLKLLLIKRLTRDFSNANLEEVVAGVEKVSIISKENILIHNQEQ